MIDKHFIHFTLTTLALIISIPAREVSDSLVPTIILFKNSEGLNDIGICYYLHKLHRLNSHPWTGLHFPVFQRIKLDPFIKKTVATCIFIAV